MHTKLFIGVRLTPELKASLPLEEGEEIYLIPYEGKEYVGRYVKNPHPTLDELRAECRAFTDFLQRYLPDVRADTLPLVVAPQLLLG